jgi:transposase, IS5 family
MHQTKKGTLWHFGMKLPIGADTQSGLIDSAETTAADVHDSQMLPELLHGEERRVYGDSAYHYQPEAIRAAAPNTKDFTNERAQ